LYFELNYKFANLFSNISLLVYFDFLHIQMYYYKLELKYDI